MFGRRAEIREQLLDIIEKFRQKGAISPEKAMTAEELGLPPRFEEAMKRRLGRLGVFVQVNSKYYLSEKRLKQLEELRSARGEAWNPRKRIMTLRLVQLVTVALFVTLMLVNLFIQRWELRIVAAVFLVAWLLLLILQIYYMSRVRRRAPSQSDWGFAKTLKHGASPLKDKPVIGIAAAGGSGSGAVNALHNLENYLRWASIHNLRLGSSNPNVKEA